MKKKNQVLVVLTILPPQIRFPRLQPQQKSGGCVSNKWNIIDFWCSDFYVDTVMLKYLTVLDGARVDISNYVGLVCGKLCLNLNSNVSKDLRTIKSLDARLQNESPV